MSQSEHLRHGENNINLVQNKQMYSLSTISWRSSRFLSERHERDRQNEMKIDDDDDDDYSVPLSSPLLRSVFVLRRTPRKGNYLHHAYQL